MLRDNSLDQFNSVCMKYLFEEKPKLTRSVYKYLADICHSAVYSLTYRKTTMAYF